MSLPEVYPKLLPINASDKERVVVDIMSKNDYVTTAIIAEQLNITQRAALDILKKLIDKGYVLKSGANRNAKYSLNIVI